MTMSGKRYVWCVLNRNGVIVGVAFNRQDAAQAAAAIEGGQVRRGRVELLDC